MEEKVLQKFQELFGDWGDIRLYFAPGRVNLIGEHTDYNGGHVFPCALTMGTYAAARARGDRRLRFYSMNVEEAGVVESSLDELVPEERAGWTNYPKGVIWAFGQRGWPVERGLDMVIFGDIPNGSGLSSSASLEVLTALAVKDLLGFDGLSMQDLALLGQFAENQFNGMNCGIMDQFASAMGRKDHAIFLDTATLEFEYAPVQLRDAAIVITNSKVKHSLVDSAYNDRRRESEAALHQLQKQVPIHALGELDAEQFARLEESITDPICRKRARHAVLENQRTIRAVQALRQGDLEEFGRLMNASHISLRDDYEVSCEEIDFLVEQAWNIPGVLGSRITGGGFGGCTVSVVKREAVEPFLRTVTDAYRKRFGREAECYVVQIGDGAHRLS